MKTIVALVTYIFLFNHLQATSSSTGLITSETNVSTTNDLDLSDTLSSSPVVANDVSLDPRKKYALAGFAALAAIFGIGFMGYKFANRNKAAESTASNTKPAVQNQLNGNESTPGTSDANQHQKDIDAKKQDSTHGADGTKQGPHVENKSGSTDKGSSASTVNSRQEQQQLKPGQASTNKSGATSSDGKKVRFADTRESDVQRQRKETGVGSETTPDKYFPGDRLLTPVYVAAEELIGFYDKPITAMRNKTQTEAAYTQFTNGFNNMFNMDNIPAIIEFFKSSENSPDTRTMKSYEYMRKRLAILARVQNAHEQLSGTGTSFQEFIESQPETADEIIFKSLDKDGKEISRLIAAADLTEAQQAVMIDEVAEAVDDRIELLNKKIDELNQMCQFVVLKLKELLVGAEERRILDSMKDIFATNCNGKPELQCTPNDILLAAQEVANLEVECDMGLSYLGFLTRLAPKVMPQELINAWGNAVIPRFSLTPKKKESTSEDKDQVLEEAANPEETAHTLISLGQTALWMRKLVHSYDEREDQKIHDLDGYEFRNFRRSAARTCGHMLYQKEKGMSAVFSQDKVECREFFEEDVIDEATTVVDWQSVIANANKMHPSKLFTGIAALKEEDKPLAKQLLNGLFTGLSGAFLSAARQAQDIRRNVHCYSSMLPFTQPKEPESYFSMGRRAVTNLLARVTFRSTPEDTVEQILKSGVLNDNVLESIKKEFLLIAAGCNGVGNTFEASKDDPEEIAQNLLKVVGEAIKAELCPEGIKRFYENMMASMKARIQSEKEKKKDE